MIKVAGLRLGYGLPDGADRNRLCTYGNVPKEGSYNQDQPDPQTSDRCNAIGSIHCVETLAFGVRGRQTGRPVSGSSMTSDRKSNTCASVSGLMTSLLSPWATI